MDKEDRENIKFLAGLSGKLTGQKISRCPKCESTKIEISKPVEKWSTYLGIALGSVGIRVGARALTTAGFAVAGAPFGPIGVAAGAVLGTVVGATAGAAIGRQFGSQIDRQRGDYKCLDCGYRFRSE